MKYKVFNFKSLKLVIAKISDDNYIGYSIDSKYPEYNRAIIRGSAKEVVEVSIYLYRQRLFTAINCEWYEIPNPDTNINDGIEIRDWVEYVLNRYLFGTFNMYYEHVYKEDICSYVADDGTPCSLIDYVEDGITIQHWE